MMITKIKAMKGTLLQKDNYHQLLERPEDFVGRLSHYPAYGYLSQREVSVAERIRLEQALATSYAMDQQKIRRFMSDRQKKRKEIHPVMAQYLALKQQEIQRLIGIIEGIYYQMPKAEILKRLKLL